MTKENVPFRTSLFAHKGEVVLQILNPDGMNSVFMAPQAAREMAQNLIDAAEAAEQQMDEQSAKGD